MIERREPWQPVFVGFETLIGLGVLDVYDPIVVGAPGTTMLKDVFLARVSLPYVSLGWTTQTGIAAITPGSPTAIELTGAHGEPTGETFPIVLSGIVQTGGVALDINGSWPGVGHGRATATGATTLTIPVDTTARTYTFAAGAARPTQEYFYTEALRLNVSDLRCHRTYLNPLSTVGDASAFDAKCSLAMRRIPQIDPNATSMPPVATGLKAPFNTHVCKGQTVTANAGTVFRTLYEVPAGEKFLIKRIGVMLGGTAEISVGVADDAAGTNYAPLMGTRGGDAFPRCWRYVEAGKFILVRNIETVGAAEIGCGYVEGDRVWRHDGMHPEGSAILLANAATTYAELIDVPAGDEFLLDRYALMIGDTDLAAVGQADDVAGTNWLPFAETTEVLQEGNPNIVVVGPRKILLKNVKAAAADAYCSGWASGTWRIR